METDRHSQMVVLVCDMYLHRIKSWLGRRNGKTLMHFTVQVFLFHTSMQHPVGGASWSAPSHWLLRVSAQYSIAVPFTLQNFK